LSLARRWFARFARSLGSARLPRRARSPTFAAAWAIPSVVALAVAPARVARGQATARPRVAIVSAVDDTFGLRVRAELEALGFDARITPADPDPPSRESLEAAARAVGGIAAIRGVATTDGVEVWIADRVTGKTVLRRMVTQAQPAAGDAASRDGALAIRVVELLRASFLETLLPSAPRGEVPATRDLGEKLKLRESVAPLADAPLPVAPLPPSPSPATPPPAPPLPASSLLGATPLAAPPSVRLSLAAGAFLSPGGFPATLALDLALSWMPSDHVGGMIFAAFSPSPPEVSHGGSSAELSSVLAGAGARFVFTPPTSRWVPWADLGVDAVVVTSRATTTAAGFTQSSATAATPAPFGRLGLAFALTPLVRLRADVLVNVVAQGVTVQFGSTGVATWGRPIAAPTLGVDFGWF
jgi:hypothetical protein